MNYSCGLKIYLLAIGLTVCGLTQTSKASEQDDSNALFQTDGMWNGRLWLSFTAKNQKTTFLMAYHDAVAQTAIAASDPSRPPAERLTQVNGLVEKCWPTSLTLGEVQLSLDRFYDTPENRPITLARAITMIALRAGTHN